MRISDWSSDVCSSDLARVHREPAAIDGSQRQRPSVGHAEAGAGGEVAQHVDLVVDVVVGAAKHGRAARAAAERPGNDAGAFLRRDRTARVERSEEHTSELQSLMRISYAVFCLKK